MSITDVDTSTQSGKVAVTDTLILKIDDEGSYTPGWDSDVTASNGGMLQIVFTPNAGAGDTTLNYVLTIANNTYDPDGEGSGAAVAIFTVGGDATAHTDPKVIISGSFEFTAGNASATTEINLAQIQAALGVNGSFTLPTLDDYTAYKTALDNVKLVLTITEAE